MSDRRPLWKEPLLHFLLIGALLYGVDTWRQAGSPSSYASGASDLQPIVISSSQVEDARRRAESQLPGRGPQAHEKREEFVHDSLQQQIRREALVQEARRMGLHRGDTIVRRRLVQKMEFLLRDLADIPEPSDDELREWVRQHPDRYRRPATVTLRHVFFRDGSGRDADDTKDAKDAKTAALDALERGVDPQAPTVGDAFAHGSHLKNQTRSAITQKFGRDFAGRAFDRAEARADSLPTDWFGPVKSAYGFHLVRLEAYSADELLPLAQMRRPARAAYLEAKRKAAGERATRRLVEKYPIRIEGAADLEGADEK